MFNVLLSVIASPNKTRIKTKRGNLYIVTSMRLHRPARQGFTPFAMTAYKTKILQFSIDFTSPDKCRPLFFIIFQRSLSSHLGEKGIK